MAFSWLGMFGAHDYMHLRQFLLQELRSVDSHALQLDTEIKRIGRAKIVWAKDDKGNATEQRLGLRVFPLNSSLAKLMKAYVAQGGNPFDICMYLDPDTGVEFGANDDGSMKYHQPYGGLLTVKTRENPTAGFDAGGELIYHKNPRLRTGKEINQDRAEVIGEQITSAREWANRAIRQKRSDIEWQIIKMLDLSEQLREERVNVLGQAVANMLSNWPMSPAFAKKYTLQHHIRTLDKIVFKEDEDTKLPIYGELNTQSFQRGHYDYLFPPRQKGEDDWTGMKIPDGMTLKGLARVDVVDGIAAPTDGSEVDDGED